MRAEKKSNEKNIAVPQQCFAIRYFDLAFYYCFHFLISVCVWNELYHNLIWSNKNENETNNKKIVLKYTHKRGEQVR